jgi:predicted O-linked N-acetylglucosamine transferase (SPINDLY family)
MDGEGSVAKRSLRAEAAALGLPEGRLCFAKLVPKPKHLDRMALAAVFVDSAEYSAHTIAADPLQARLPLLACSGAAYSSRVSASILVAAGLPNIPLPHAQHDQTAAAAAAAGRRKRWPLRVSLRAAAKLINYFSAWYSCNLY